VSRVKYGVPEVYAAMKKVAEADPMRCDSTPGRYTTGGQPDCFVAVVLVELGCRNGVLKTLDRECKMRGQGGSLAGVVLTMSVHPWLRRISPMARHMLRYAQRMNDRGEAWGMILARTTGPKEGTDLRLWMPEIPVRDPA